MSVYDLPELEIPAFNKEEAIVKEPNDNNDNQPFHAVPLTSNYTIDRLKTKNKKD
jgi:hypothetical protein